MQPLRSIAAVVAGFGFMASTVMVGTMLAAGLFVSSDAAAPDPLPVVYLAANLATNLLAAVFGGWLAARIGTSAPFGHAVALAAITAALSIGAVVQAPAAGQPAWYAVVVGIIGVAGVLAGGRLRAAAAAPGAVVA